MPHIGLSEKNRQEMSNTLNNLLSNEYVLYTKTLKYHWNVVGKLFGPLHALFESQYTQLFANIDKIAERIRALGHIPYGTLQEFTANSTLSEDPEVNPDSAQMIQDLLEDHEAIIRQLRADIDLSVELNDTGTNNFLGDLIESHEKTAWMLRAHLA